MKKKRNRRALILIACLLSIGAGAWFVSMQREPDLTLIGWKRGSKYFLSIPIEKFSFSAMPLLPLKIQKQHALVGLDLGSSERVTLPHELLQRLSEKKFVTQRTFYGFRGKTYQSDLYHVPKLKIGPLVLFPIEVEEMNVEFQRDACLQGTKEPLEGDTGSVGWSAFRHLNLLVDCPYSELAVCDSIETLREHGYPVDEFTEVPLLFDRGFLELEANTDFGVLRCMLDTGSTFNLLNYDFENPSNSHRILHPKGDSQREVFNPENKDMLEVDFTRRYESSTFVIGGKEFGPILLGPIKSPLQVELVLGMEFFDFHLVFIDFCHSKLYFLHRPNPEGKRSYE